MLRASSPQPSDSLQAAGARESHSEEHGDAYGQPGRGKAAGREEGVLDSWCYK